MIVKAENSILFGFRKYPKHQSFPQNSTMQKSSSSSSSSSNNMSFAVAKTTDEKVAQIFQKYDDANAEIAELESRVRQKESEVKVQASENVKKQEEVNRLKGELAVLTQSQTMLTETLKHQKVAITQQREQRTENYNKMVAVEDAIKALKEQDKRNLREHNNFLERMIEEKLARRELLLQRMQEAHGGVGASSASASASSSSSAAGRDYAAAQGLRLLANSEVAETDGLAEGHSALMNEDANVGMDGENPSDAVNVSMEVE